MKVVTANTPTHPGPDWRRIVWSAPQDITSWDVLPGTGHDDLMDTLGFTFRYSPVVPQDKMLAVQPGKVTMFDLADGPDKTVTGLVEIGPDGKMRIVHVKDLTDDI